eukprot:CCRYP_007570-RA/>CCRYP_007570-RA protein AED:0.00 eAED:0.00 QI:18/1/1/1/0/0/2/194/63
MRFFSNHHNSPFVGASDIGHGSNWPETCDLAWDQTQDQIKIGSCKHHDPRNNMTTAMLNLSNR